MQWKFSSIQQARRNGPSPTFILVDCQFSKLDLEKARHFKKFPHQYPSDVRPGGAILDYLSKRGSILTVTAAARKSGANIIAAQYVDGDDNTDVGLLNAANKKQSDLLKTHYSVFPEILPLLGNSKVLAIAGYNKFCCVFWTVKDALLKGFKVVTSPDLLVGVPSGDGAQEITKDCDKFYLNNTLYLKSAKDVAGLFLPEKYMKK